jgi:hypothetical protein
MEDSSGLHWDLSELSRFRLPTIRKCINAKNIIPDISKIKRSCGTVHSPMKKA